MNSQEQDNLPLALHLILWGGGTLLVLWLVTKVMIKIFKLNHHNHNRQDFH